MNFLERFKGKTCLLGKDGIFGLANSTSEQQKVNVKSVSNQNQTGEDSSPVRQSVNLHMRKNTDSTEFTSIEEYMLRDHPTSCKQSNKECQLPQFLNVQNFQSEKQKVNYWLGSKKKFQHSETRQIKLQPINPQTQISYCKNQPQSRQEDFQLNRCQSEDFYKMIRRKPTNLNQLQINYKQKPITKQNTMPEKKSNNINNAYIDYDNYQQNNTKIHQNQQEQENHLVIQDQRNQFCAYNNSNSNSNSNSNNSNTSGSTNTNNSKNFKSHKIIQNQIRIKKDSSSSNGKNENNNYLESDDNKKNDRYAIQQQQEQSCKSMMEQEPENRKIFSLDNVDFTITRFTNQILDDIQKIDLQIGYYKGNKKYSSILKLHNRQEETTTPDQQLINLGKKSEQNSRASQIMNKIRRKKQNHTLSQKQLSQNIRLVLQQK